MSDKPIIAIMYDFDKTLSTRDMQDFALIPSLGMESSDFWQAANDFGREQKMDGILAYMYTAIRESRRHNKPLRRENLLAHGKYVEFFPGVETWFNRINEYAKTQGAEVEHYIISSGMKEIIEGTPIANEFKEIFACEYYFDENGDAVWPKTAVNYTNKTQFVYRINKGVLDVSNDTDLNRSMPDDSKRVPFTNMIYLGDGLSDVPCMKMMQAYGGTSIAVYPEGQRNKVEELLLKDRVNFIFPADYRQESELSKAMESIIRKIAICDTLTEISEAQLKSINS
ncbi:MAG: haloacid dehalogenase-like hydrolase [Ruminococcaceae bacterium]|nr:haloacid dehalogenase-like hydrolase [Oscillospiraceae bacterium]